MPTRTTHDETPAFSPPGPSDATRELALTAPMLLLAHGLLLWIDDLGGWDGSGLPWFLAEAALIGSALAFMGLAIGLRHPAGGGALTTSAIGAATVGGLATIWVALASGVGGVSATDPAPPGALVAGPVLLAAGMGALLTQMVRRARLGGRHAALIAAGVLLLAAPGGLVPVAALAILIGLEPLMTPADRAQ